MGKYKVMFKMIAYAQVVVEAEDEEVAEDTATSELCISNLVHVQHRDHGTSLTIAGSENTLEINTDDVEIEEVENID